MCTAGENEKGFSIGDQYFLLLTILHDWIFSDWNEPQLDRESYKAIVKKTLLDLVRNFIFVRSAQPPCPDVYFMGMQFLRGIFFSPCSLG